MLELLLIAACVHQPTVHKTVMDNRENEIRVADSIVNSREVNFDMSLGVDNVIATTYLLTTTPEAEHFAALLYVPFVLNVQQPVPEDAITNFVQSVGQDPMYLGTWNMFLESKEQKTAAVYIESTAAMYFDPVTRKYEINIYDIAITTVAKHPKETCTNERVDVLFSWLVENMRYNTFSLMTDNASFPEIPPTSIIQMNVSQDMLTH